MDDNFDDHDALLKQAYRIGDIDWAWALWPQFAEETMIDCIVGNKWEISERERRKYRDRRRPCFQTQKRKRPFFASLPDFVL